MPKTYTERKRERNLLIRTIRKLYFTGGKSEYEFYIFMDKYYGINPTNSKKLGLKKLREIVITMGGEI